MLLSAIQDLVTVDAGQNHLAQLVRFQVATAFGVSETKRPINQASGVLQLTGDNPPSLELDLELRALFFPSNGLLARLQTTYPSNATL